MLLRKVKVASKNPIIIYEDYAEIVLLDRNGNEKARAKVYIDKLSLVRKYRWHLGNNGYVYSSNNTQLPRTSLHRLIAGAPKGLQVDHEDLDKLNNTNENLRICSQSKNKMNTGVQSNNKSGVTGVFFEKSAKMWKAMIYVNKKAIYLGHFKELNEAREVRAKAEEKYFKDFRYKPIEVD